MWRIPGILLFCFAALAQENARTAVAPPNAPATSAAAATLPADAKNDAPSAPATNDPIIITNTPYKIPENQILQFPVQLTREARIALTPKNQVVDYVKGAIAVDRKSTRLNSSHSQISYAVFCLKKK